MFAKTLLPALAVFGVVAAQTSSLCSSDATINGQGDADRYASCETIDGDVNIGSTASGNININGPTSITGTLKASNASTLFSIGSTTIESIGGSFILDRLEQLSTLSFDKLEEVGDISWNALGNLGQLTLPSIISKADKVVITNTFLRTLDGINLVTVKTLDISNNRRLQTFSTQVTSVSELINIASNGAELEVSFPNLIWAKEVTFRNVSMVSIPSLKTVNGSLGFYATYMEGLQAPNLTTVGNIANGQAGALSFVANEAMTNLSMPALISIGGAALIANNTVLEDISFPALTQIGGAIDFSGVFTTPELPKLSDVKGAFNMQSKSTLDCSAFDKLKSVVQGKFTCVTTSDAKSADGTVSSGSGTTTSGGSSASASPSSAAVAFGAGEAVVGMSALGALFSLLL